MRKHTRCKVDKCDSPGHIIKGVEYYTKGYCKKHYLRVCRYGDANIVKYNKNWARTKHPLYHTYQNMKGRCYNSKDAAYKYYGERGIKVCERWLGYYGFDNFLEDMGKRPEHLTLDRVDNDGNYEPSNCRWATRSEQVINRRAFRNKSGHRGVYWVEKENKFMAQIARNGKQVTIGRYITLDEAIAARKNKEAELAAMI